MVDSEFPYPRVTRLALRGIGTRDLAHSAAMRSGRVYRPAWPVVPPWHANSNQPSRVRGMPTVREASFDFFRTQGMTTIFGNPGSTELPMLAEFPGDFRFVLGLHEAVVVGMADGYAQASGRTAIANLHTAPGVGNAMGAIFNAQANHTPLLVTAGQQTRAQMTLQANLTNRDAIRMPHPLVKWSYEPPRAEEVPDALARAIHLASLPPRGPAFVSVPMDDWDTEVDDGAVIH